MKKFFYLLLGCIVFPTVWAQTKSTDSPYKHLSNKDYKILRDSCTQLDVVFTTGKGGSMSLEGRSVNLFSSFVDIKTISAKSNSPKDGFIMWQRNGKEFITGDIYLLSDSMGYLLFKKDNREYYHMLTQQGATFLRSQKK